MFKRAFGSILGLLLSTVLFGQTRQWNQVALSDGSLPSTLSLGQVVEKNPGGRGALVSWMDSSSSNIIVGLQDGTLRKIVYSLGSVTPSVTTPTINGWPGSSYKIRSLHRSPNGTLFMTATTAAEGVWNGSTLTQYDPTLYYTGEVWVSVDSGATWSRLTAAGASISNAGYVALYPAWAAGSLGGYAGRVGGAGISAYDIMEFGDSGSAGTYGGAITITQSGTTRYFGVKLAAASTASTIGEPVMNSGGAITWPITFSHVYYSWGSNAGCSGGPYYTTINGYGTSWFNADFKTGIWWGKSCGDSVKTFVDNVPQDYAYWYNQELNSTGGTACNTVGGGPGSNPICNGYNYIWTVGNLNSNTNNRREKLVSTFDNSGLLLRASYLNDNGYSANGVGGNTDGVIVYRGAASGSAAPSVIMGGTNNTDAYSHGFLSYPQESYAGHSGFLAVVSSTASTAQAQIYVSENTPAFVGNQNLVSTSFGTTNTSRVMITGANALNPGSTAADLSAWNGKLLAIGQDGWALGTPTATRLAVFTVPSSATVSALADGSPATGGTASGCSVVLQGSISGEPNATVYWWWQQAGAGGVFPAITSLGGASGSGTIGSNGLLALDQASGRSYTVPSSGSYRLVVAGVLGGLVYDVTPNSAPNGNPSNASLGIASGSTQVVLQTAPTLTNPLVLVNGTQVGTSSATVCGGDTVQLSVVLNGSGTATWTKNGAAAGTGTTLYISAANTGTTNIVDTYVASATGSCAGSSVQSFTVTTQPQLGAVTVTRTVAGTGAPDTVGGCSGVGVVFSASASAASNWSWLESTDNNTFYPSASGSSTFSLPRLASGPALNANPSFESGITGWTSGSWLAVTPPGGAPNGSNALNGTSAQTIWSNGYILVDSTQPYLYASIAKNAAQGGTQMSMVVECFDQNKASTANINLSAATLTSSWTTYGSFIGAGTSYPFPANTVWVRLRVSMPGSVAPGAYLDAVRLIPVTATEMAQVNSFAYGIDQWKYAQYWDLRAGSTASGSDTRSYYYRASASNVCQVVTSTSQELRSDPRVWFTTHDIQLTDGTSIMVPDANPANPLVATICGSNIVTMFAPATASGTIGFLWQTCTDYTGVGTGSWSAVQGNSQGSSFQLVTNGSVNGATTFYRLVATGGCDGLPYYSRVFKIIEAPAPAITAPLSGPTTGCSRQVINMGVSYVNGTPIWEQSVDGGAWTAASPLPTIVGQSGTNYTYQVQLPVVTGGTARTIAFRVRMGASGCTEVVSTLQGILVNPEVTLTGGMVQGFSGSTGTFCDGTTVQLAVVYTPGSATVAWTDGSGNPVGSGTSFTFTTSNQTNANIVSTYRATITASCGSPVTQTFTITVTPGLGALSVTRTNSTGGTDGVAGCSGDVTNFSASALAASGFQWQESPDGVAWNNVSTASSLSIPRLASGPALNANASFEGGNTGWENGSWDAVTPPAPGAANGVLAMNGTTAQDIRTASFILVDSTKPYLYAAVAKNGAQAGTTATLILECYDYQKSATSPASIALPSTVMVPTWTTFGAFVGAGTSYPLPTGTAYVKLRVAMPASASPGAYLDAVRLIPVTPADMAQVLATAPSGDNNRFAQWWDVRAGRDATGTDSKTWTYQVTASNACATTTSARLDQTTSPKVFFTNHDISMNNVSIAVPDPNPVFPISATVCGVQSLSITAPATGNGTLAYRWETCTDYNQGTGVGSWVSATGTNSANNYSVTTTGSLTGVTTFYRLKATGGCDGLPYFSRVFKIVEAPAPSVLTNLAGPANVCSRAPITMTISYVNGSLVWEQSIGGAPWTTASSVPTLVSQVGNNYTYTVAAPTLTGDYTQTLNYRVRLTSSGCGDVISTLPQTITVSPEVTFGSYTINGAVATSASLCPTDAGVLSTNVTGGNGYQWYTQPVGGSSWTAVPGGTSATLTISAPTQTVVTSNQYFLRVTGPCTAGIDSAVFTLTFKAGAEITVQPSAPAQTCSGTMQALSFTSAGATAYSWIESSSDGSPTITLPASASISVPALASGAALNPDPSFETGIDGIERAAGATGSSMAWDRTTAAYLGSSSLHTYGGEITLRHPSGSALIPVDPSLPYLVIAGAYSSANLTGSLGVIAYDTNKVQISQTWLNSATAVSLGTTWTPFGAFLNAGGTSTALPPAAAYVKILVRLNEGGVVEEGHLDDLRIIPLGGDELSILNTSIPSGMTMSAFWDGRAGKDASGTTIRSYNYVGTALSACGAVQTRTVNVVSVPKPFITQQPQDVVVCGGQSTTFSTTVNGGGTLSYTWQSSNDGVQWAAITGANSSSYFYTAPVVSTSTTFKLRLVAISTCGTVVTRVATVTLNPAPVVQQDLQVQTVACSGDVVPIKFSGIGSTPTWEASQDGGAWSAIAPILQADGTYRLTMPLVTGSSSSTLSLRATLGSPYGCQPVMSSTRSITIRPQVAIQTQPQGLVECLTSPTGSLSVAASGSSLVYQWQVNTGSGWSPIPGATSYSYTPQPPNNSTADYAATYRVLLSGDCGGGLVSDAVPVVMYAPPKITTQPQGTTLATGGSTTFAVFATGTGLTYQWQSSQDGGSYLDIAGATGATYSTGALTAPAGTSPMVRYYRVVVSTASNACSPVMSSTATVTVYPAINATPKIDTVIPACSGASVAMSTNITSGASTSTRWQVLNGSWQDIPGATTGFYSVSQTVTGGSAVSASYRSVVTDVVGQQFYGDPLVVTWNPATVIVTQPKNVSIATGQSATMSVVATGVGLTYAWDQSTDGISWSQVVGATSSSYTASGPGLVAAPGTTSTVYYFRVRVGGSSCDPISSSMAQVTVYPVPAAVPAFDRGMPVCSGTAVGMNANVSSGANLSLKWQIFQAGAWADMPGATSNYYSVSQSATGSTPVSTAYRVFLTDPVGQTWAGPTMTATWNPLTAIVTQPQGSTVCQGGNANLSVAFTGVSGLQLLWQSSADGLGWSDMPGATGTTLALSNLTTTAQYRARVYGGGCQDVYSSAVQVVVNPKVAITVQPAPATICSGDSASLAVQATGTNLVYRWERLNGSTWQLVTNGPSATASVALTNLGTTDSQVSFRVTVSGDCGTPVISQTVAVTVKPGINFQTQPALNTTICNNGSTTLFFAGSGFAAIDWQTSADGGSTWGSAGSTTTSVTTGPLVTGIYLYRAQVVDLCGNTHFTNIAQVEARATARVTTQPQPVTVCSGQAATFSVVANVQDASYQWYTASAPDGSWGAITGANTAQLNLSNLSNVTGVATMSYYRVVVTPVACDQPITSSIVSLTVRPGTAVLVQPTPVDSCLNSVATTTVSVTGEQTSVKWQLSSDGTVWTDIAGANSTTLQVSTAQIGTWLVRAVTTGGCGTVISQPVQVKVSGPTTIQSQPASTTACEGAAVNFSVQASGAALSYQWQRSEDAGTTWSAVGSSQPTLSVIATKRALFRVIVYGGGGCSDQVISSPATLDVTSLPQDVPLEAPIYASAGRQVWLQVATSGPSYDTVTWTMGSQVLTGPSVVLQVPAQPGTYKVVVTASKNGCQSVTSWNLDVATRGNGDGTQDGAIDGRDFARFEAAFGTKAGERGFDAVFDLNGDGVIDQADEDLFWAAYGAAAQPATAANVGGTLSAHLGQYLPEAVDSDELRRRMNPTAHRTAWRAA